MAKLNKNSKTILYLGAGVVSAVLVYFGYDIIKSKADAKKYSSNDMSNPANTSNNGNGGGLTTDDIASNASQVSNDPYPLKVGSYGTKVFVLQEALNKLGNSLVVDGKFGNKTYDAVKNVSGFGLLSFTCFDYSCGVSYDDWSSIIKKAETKGFNTNASWTKAKKIWSV